MNYTSYIASTFIEERLKPTVRTIRLTPKWWQRYHEDMCIMEAQMRANKRLRFQDHHDFVVISPPRSITILKKILLIRAAASESIKIKGLVDVYFFMAATAPETRNNTISSQTFKVSHTVEDDEFYTCFELVSFSRPQKRRRYDQGSDILRALKSNHIMRFVIGGFSQYVFLLFCSTLKSKCADKALEILLRKIEHDTVQPTLKTGNLRVLTWRLQFEKGFSITLSQGVDNSKDDSDRDAVSGEYNSGIGSNIFFVIEYQHASFILRREDKDAVKKTIDQIFAVLSKNNTALSIELKGHEQDMIYDKKIHPQIAHYLAQDYHVISDKCYRFLDFEWGDQNVFFKEELRDIFGSQNAALIQKIKSTHEMVDLVNVFPCYYKHAIRKMAKDPVMEKAMIFFQKDTERPAISSLGGDVLNFSVYMKVGASIKQAAKIRIKDLAQNIMAAAHKSEETHKALKSVMRTIIKDASQHNKDLTELQAIGRFFNGSVGGIYHHLIFWRDSHFYTSAFKDVLIIHTGACSLDTLQALQDLTNLVNLLYFFSMEAAALEGNLSWKKHFAKRCLMPKTESRVTVMILMSFTNIVKLLKAHLFNEKFDHYAATRADIARQKVLFQEQLARARKTRKDLERVMRNVRSIHLVSSIHYLFDRE